MAIEKTGTTLYEEYRLSRWRGAETARRILRNQRIVVGGVVLILLLIVALGAPALAPYSPDGLGTGNPLEGASLHHIFGTDQLGRDILSRVIFGARTSLLESGLAVGIALCLGIPIGLISGYFGGWFDLGVQRVVEVLQCFPFLILALLIVIVLGTSTWNVALALGIGVLPGLIRLQRATVLNVMQRDFVQVARATGATDMRIILRHVLPNTLTPIIIAASLLTAGAILAEASLSYLGLGTQPPTPSWGYDLNAGRLYLEVNAWLVAGPGIAMVLTVVAFNLLGDGIRDLLDPRLRI